MKLLEGFRLPANLLNEVLHSLPVFHVALIALVPIRLLTILYMEHRGNMWLDGEPSIIASGLEVAHDVLKVTVALSRHGVLGFGLPHFWIAAVFDVDMHNVLLDVIVES